MPKLKDQTFNLILTDLPYDTTECPWDVPLPLEVLWYEWWRLLKPDGIVVLFAATPFNFTLVGSQSQYWRYRWIWEKTCATCPMLAKKQPLRADEEIHVFCRQSMAPYYPQMSEGKPYKAFASEAKTGEIYGKNQSIHKENLGTRYPRSVLHTCTGSSIVICPNCNAGADHPTQKPLDLLRFLIRTYTLPGESVLDCCMGSGGTCLAAEIEGRDFVGIELDSNYFNVALNKISKHILT